MHTQHESHPKLMPNLLFQYDRILCIGWRYFFFARLNCKLDVDLFVEMTKLQIKYIFIWTINNNNESDRTTWRKK